MQVFLGDISGLVGRHIDRFDVVHIGYCVVQGYVEGRILCEFCPKEVYVCQIHALGERKCARWCSDWEEMRQKLSLC